MWNAEHIIRQVPDLRSMREILDLEEYVRKNCGLGLDLELGPVLKTAKTVLTRLHQLDDNSNEYGQILEKGEEFVAECTRVMWESVLEDPQMRSRVARDVFRDDTLKCLPSKFDNDSIRKVHRMLLQIPDERLVAPSCEEDEPQARSRGGKKRQKTRARKRRVVTLREYLDYADMRPEDVREWLHLKRAELINQSPISQDNKFSNYRGVLALGLVFGIILYATVYF